MLHRTWKQSTKVRDTRLDEPVPKSQKLDLLHHPSCSCAAIASTQCSPPFLGHPPPLASVVLATLLLGNLVTATTIALASHSQDHKQALMLSSEWVLHIHVVLEGLQVRLLLSQLLLELQELFLLTLANRKVFVGLLTLLKGITICR